jgi:hypothetical protein
MKSALKHASWVVAGLLPAALATRADWAMTASAVFLAVLGLAVFCWIIASADRSARLTRMILARRADARCLEPDNTSSTSPTVGSG